MLLSLMDISYSYTKGEVRSPASNWLYLNVKLPSMVQMPIHIKVEAGNTPFMSIMVSMIIGRINPTIRENQNQLDAFPFNRRLIDALTQGFCMLLRSNRYMKTEMRVMASVAIKTP